MKKMKKLFAASLVGVCLAVAFPGTINAAVSSWQKSVTISSRWNTDFESETFKQSVKNAAGKGANMITLSFPWYQSNLSSTDIQAGWQTPTDQALAAGMDYVHSQGLAVTVKPHLESYSGEWRAYINPSDRAAWFANYGAKLNQVGVISKQHSVEQIIIGSELINMSSQYTNPTNTQNWKNLIASLKTKYSGKLTYSANWGESGFVEEKNQVAFWSDLDYLGTNGYYELRTNDTDPRSLAQWWSKWENEHINPWRQANGNKPVLFTEAGYKSVSGAQWRPWDYTLGGGADETTQANLYESFMQYWGPKSYVAGLHIWEWSSDPNYGGAGNTDYTPWQKKAATVMSSWFAGGGTQLPPGTTTPPAMNCGNAGSGTFTGCYYHGRNFETLALSRTDNTINFGWGYGSPASAVGSDNFSVKWEGNFNFDQGNFNFTATADDGIKILVDNAVLLDKWIDQPSTTYTFQKSMTAGIHNIKVLYYENGGEAIAKVSWAKSASTTPPPPPPSGGNNPPPSSPNIVYKNGYPTLNGNYIDCNGNIDNDMSHHTTDPGDQDPAHHVGQNCPAGSFVGKN